MTEEFPIRKFRDAFPGEFVYCDEKTFHGITQCNPVIYNIIESLYSKELIGSPIISAYFRGFAPGTKITLIFRCLICEYHGIPCRTFYHEYLNDLYNHIVENHYISLPEETRHFTVNCKWYWVCVRYHYVRGFDNNYVRNFEPGDIDYDSLINLSHMCVCAFCGDEYGSTPSREVIISHLDRCEIIGEIARAVKCGKRKK